MKRDYSALFLFCGLGGGALGFTQAAARLFGHNARFRSIGGIDNDPAACEDFEYLTKSPALCTDLATMTPGALREFAGERAPDVVFSSAPCKADSGLTNRKLAKSEKYVDMAELYVTGAELMLSTWDVPPRLVLQENVSRILSNGAGRVARVTSMLEEAGYAVHISTHDCGELGGLAQRRRRALLVARYRKSVSCYLYQPPKQRVRACGEVLGELPLPETPSAGPMHKMPRIGWLTWVRLAMIPARGDHRDLPGVLAKEQARRSLWARRHVEHWGDPSVTVTTDGTNGAYGVSDPRVTFPRGFTNLCAVSDWANPTRTVVGGTRPAGGGLSVSDPRVLLEYGGRNGAFRTEHWSEPTHTILGPHGTGGNPHVADPRIVVLAGHPTAFGVKDWGQSSNTVTGHGHPSGGAFSVRDPRIAEGGRFKGAHGIRDWFLPAATVTQGGATGGRFSVNDPRVLPQADNPDAYWNKHRVSGWDAAAGAVTGSTRAGSGAPSIQDPRLPDGGFSQLGIVDWALPSGTITGRSTPSSGRFTVPDPRVVTGPARRGREDAPGDIYHGSLGVVPWHLPAATISSMGNPAKGKSSVADPRVKVNPSKTWTNPSHCYYSLPWGEPSFTVHAKAHPGTGAYTVGDGRRTTQEQGFGLISLADAMDTVYFPKGEPSDQARASNGPWAIVNADGEPLVLVDGAKDSPFVLIEEPAKTPRSKPKTRKVKVPVVIIAADGTWHRPMTPLELARLQDLPAFVDGAPLKLSGDNVGAWVERIGNAVPVGTAQAIAEQMLITLLASDYGAGLAPSGGVVWVDRALEGAILQ